MLRPATLPHQRPSDARLLVVGSDGSVTDEPRSRLIDHLRSGDVLVANDAATLPASLRGTHVRTGAPIEMRLAGRPLLATDRVGRFTAVAFGAGDHRTPTENRAAPPALSPGDRLELGPLRARVVRVLGHPRLVELAFAGTPDEIWAGIATHGRPIQYAHVPEPLALWDVWTRVAALPVAFEPPSAGFVLDWRILSELRARGVAFATLTLAAGLSSTGDAELDRRLPLDEPYHVPEATAREVAAALKRGGRVVALGTTAARALEHAADRTGVRAGPGLATRRLGPDTPLRVVDVLVTGIHAPGDPHYDLLGALAPEHVLRAASETAAVLGYRTHEFGDSMVVTRFTAAEARCLEQSSQATPMQELVAT